MKINKDGPLANKTFMLTGKLDGISRAEAKSLIEENSGSIISNVSKKLDYLIKQLNFLWNIPQLYSKLFVLIVQA